MGRIAALYAHPVKGFTPQSLDRASLTPKGAFPGDRLFAVEDGASGFDPLSPVWVPKSRFAVLAKTAAVAKVRTTYDVETGVLVASAPHGLPFEGRIDEPTGVAAFEAWFAQTMSILAPDEARGPYRLIDGGGWRFLDHPKGHVSVLNLASVADLASRLGCQVDPLRFRANVWVDDWPAWSELSLEGREFTLGSARVRGFKPIVRCAATMVDPVSGARDLDVPSALQTHYGHLLMGLYVHVTGAGDVAVGEAVTGA